jgi:hypothetical protein
MLFRVTLIISYLILVMGKVEKLSQLSSERKREPLIYEEKWFAIWGYND